MTPRARRILAIVLVVVISLVIMKFSLWLGVIALVAGLAGARVGPFNASRLGRERGNRSLR